jgi:hypothetical protein
LLQDFRFGWRSLLKSPGFTAVAIVTLALGIGANTAIFSMVDTLMIRPLPVQHPLDLTRLQEEMEEHLALQTADHVRAGLSPSEARRQALLKFGVWSVNQAGRTFTPRLLAAELRSRARKRFTGLMGNPSP